MQVCMVKSMMHGVDYRAGPKEETCLEESMCHQVEDTGSKCADAHGDKHEAELGDG